MSKKSQPPALATDSKAVRPAQRPIQEGYVPGKRGYTPAATSSKLPQAPAGGTAQSTATTSNQNSQTQTQSPQRTTE